MNSPEIKRGGKRPGAGRPKKSSCPNCEVLVLEVAALKRELAGRSLDRAFTVADVKGPRVAVTPGVPCVHGSYVGRCGKIGCRPA